MKRVWILLIVANILLVTSAYSKPPDEDAEKKEAQIQSARELAKMKKEELNGSRWEVEMKSQDPKVKDRKDVFTFQNNQVSSKVLSKRGFGPTNYTVSAKKNSDLAVWETMQTAKEGVVFIRGQWTAEGMEGNLTEKLDDGETDIRYYFTSAKLEDIAATSAEEEGTVESKTGKPRDALVSDKKKRKGLSSY